MSTALATMNSSNDIWNCENTLAEIRKLASPSVPLTDVEFNFMVQLGRATQLNPFMREIWAVKYRRKNRDTGKYEEQPAQIFIGRDGYRKAAQRQPDYEYHQVNSVYSNDEFYMDENGIKHKAKIIDRGQLIAAYCIVKRKGASKSTYCVVTMAEYNQKHSLWNDKPETMIKKVAEAQALRQSFQEVLAGTYSDAELPKEEKPQHYIIEGITHTEKLKHMFGIGETKNEDNLGSSIGADVDEHSGAGFSDIRPSPDYWGDDAGTLSCTDEHHMRISTAKLMQIELLFTEKQFTEERIIRALSQYNVTNVADLHEKDAEEFIKRLEKAK